MNTTEPPIRNGEAGRLLGAAAWLDLVGRIQYKDWRVVIGEKNGVRYLQLRWLAECNSGSGIQEQTSRKWMLSEHMTKSEVIQTALLAVLTAEEHEAREQFLFDGRAIFGPHFDVNALVGLGAYDTRSNEKLTYPAPL